MSMRASFDRGARSSRSRWSTEAVLSRVKCLRDSSPDSLAIYASFIACPTIFVSSASRIV